MCENLNSRQRRKAEAKKHNDARDAKAKYEQECLRRSEEDRHSGKVPHKTRRRSGRLRSLLTFAVMGLVESEK